MERAAKEKEINKKAQDCSISKAKLRNGRAENARLRLSVRLARSPLLLSRKQKPFLQKARVAQVEACAGKATAVAMQAGRLAD